MTARYPKPNRLSRNPFTWIGIGVSLWLLGRWSQRQLQNVLRSNTLHLSHRLRIEAPPSEVYRFLSHFHHYPRFMSYVEDVAVSDAGTLTWQIRGPAHFPLLLHTHLVELTPEKAIEWETHPDDRLQLRGRFDFIETPRGATEVIAQLVFSSPGGRIAETLLDSLGFSPAAAFARDLSRLRELIAVDRPEATGSRFANLSSVKHLKRSDQNLETLRRKQP